MFHETLRGPILAVLLRCRDGDDHPPAPVLIFHVYRAGVVLRGPHSNGEQQRRRRASGRDGWAGVRQPGAGLLQSHGIPMARTLGRGVFFK